MSPRARRFALPLSFAALSMLGACSIPVRGSGVLAEDGFQINRFDEVDLADNISLRVSAGAADEATLRCDDNLIDRINVDVDGGVLELRYQPGVFGLPRTRCELEVHRLDIRAIDVSGSAEVVAPGELPALRAVDVSGSGSVRVGQGSWTLGEDAAGSLLDSEGSGLVDGEGEAPAEPVDPSSLLDGVDVATHLRVDVSGSGEVSIAGARGQSVDVDVSGSGDVDVSKVDVEDAGANISGSGSVRFGGAAARVEADISGSGEVYARRLDAQRAVVRVSGSGEVEVTAKESVKINISGSGDVSVWGDPEDRDRSVSGSGEIHYR